MLVVATGKLEVLENTWGEGLLRGSSELRIKFYEGVLPPGIKTGDTVTVVGRCWSSNLGQAFQVRDAILIPDKGFRMSLAKVFKKYTLAPSTFMTLPPEFAEKPKLTPK
jgi:hypothetical protein